MARKLLVCSPAKGGLPLFYLELFEDLLVKGLEGWDVDFLTEGNQNALNISRNILANAVVTGDFDDMLMLDTDMPATEAHFRRILSHDREAYPIVSGLYSMKRPGMPFWLGIRAKGARPLPNGLLEADFVPTGFLLASKAALVKVCEAHKDREFYAQEDVLSPGPRKQGATMTELFPIGVCGPRTPAARLRRVKAALAAVMEKGAGSVSRAVMVESLNKAVEALTDEQAPGYLAGEDYYFSLLAKLAGVGVWLDTRCVVPHRGGIDYPITDPAAVATSCHEIPEHEGDIRTW